MLEQRMTLLPPRGGNFSDCAQFAKKAKPASLPTPVETVEQHHSVCPRIDSRHLGLWHRFQADQVLTDRRGCLNVYLAIRMMSVARLLLLLKWESKTAEESENLFDEEVVGVGGTDSECPGPVTLREVPVARVAQPHA